MRRGLPRSLWMCRKTDFEFERKFADSERPKRDGFQLWPLFSIAIRPQRWTEKAAGTV